jgi:hypothetical protein
VTDLSADFNSGIVTLTWSAPPSGHVEGIEIRRRDDGNYPQDPSDGVLVMQVPVGQQTATDFFMPVGGLGEMAYYSVFTYGAGPVYSDGVQVGIYCDAGDCITVPDLRNLTDLKTTADAETLRTTLISEIWGIDTLPAQLPLSITDLDSTSTEYRPPNAVRAEKLIIDPGDIFFVANFNMRLFSPATPNGKLIIYHQGHRGVTNESKPVIERFLFEGYTVLDVSMPMQGYNWDPIYHPPFGLFHEDIAWLDRPMRFFFEQVSVALNYLTTIRGFNDIYMVGISGGGWTTVIYTAIDPRISASYPVAGSYPFYLRSQIGGSTIGDFEQTNLDFYQHASYLELYLLGAAGRRQLLVYNVFDECCFAGTYSNTFKMFLQTQLVSIGGSLDIALDDTFVGHMISDYALEIIVTDIASN